MTRSGLNRVEVAFLAVPFGIHPQGAGSPPRRRRITNTLEVFTSPRVVAAVEEGLGGDQVVDEVRVVIRAGKFAAVDSSPGVASYEAFDLLVVRILPQVPELIGIDLGAFAEAAEVEAEDRVPLSWELVPPGRPNPVAAAAARPLASRLCQQDDRRVLSDPRPRSWTRGCRTGVRRRWCRTRRSCISSRGSSATRTAPNAHPPGPAPHQDVAKPQPMTHVHYLRREMRPTLLP